MNPRPLPIPDAGRLLIYLALLVIPVANAPITGDTLEIKTHLFRLLGVAAAILYALITLRPSNARTFDSVDLAVALGMAGLFASLWAAESRAASLPGALDAASSYAFFLLARAVFDRDPDRSGGATSPVMAVIAIASILPAILFIAEIRHTGITDTLGNQNVVSHFLLLSICAPIYGILSRSGWARILAVGFLLAILWVIWLTAARGAVVGILVGIGALAGLWTARSWKGFSSLRKMMVASVLALAVLSPAALLYRYATSGDFNVSVRFLSWKYSISLLSDRPILGYGPGTFSTSFEKTKLWMSDEDARLLGLLSVNYAHNDYVELAVEQGAFGLSAFLFLAAMCIIPSARGIVSGAASAPLSSALLFGVVASLAQAFFDFPYHTPAPRLLFHVMLALMSIPALPRPMSETSALGAPEALTRPPDSETKLEDAPKPGPRAWGVAAGILVLAVLPALPVISIYAASAISKVAEPQFKSGRYNAVMHLHEWAGELDPTGSRYPFRQGLGHELAGEFDKASQSFRTALSLQPYFPNLYFHLGTIAMTSDPARASAAFYANVAFYQTQTALHNLAAMSLALADSSSASSLYQEIARRYPDDDRARHNAQVLRMPENQLRPQMYRRALEHYQNNRLDLALTSAQLHLAAAPADPEGLFLLGRILFHQGDYRKAEDVFLKFLGLSSEDAEGHYYLASAYFFQNRYGDAVRSYARAAQINPGSPKILYNLGVTYYTVGDAASMNDCFDTVLTINPNVSFKAKIEEIRQKAKQSQSP